MAPHARSMKIGELERLSGVPRHTIHQYVRHGLLPPPIKTGRTMALYGGAHLARLEEIKRLKGTERVPLAFLKRILGEGGASAGEGTIGAAGGGAGKAVGEARRRQIRDAAREVFLVKGYRNARIQDITAAAGVSTGTFYIYYRDKRELFMEAIDELIGDTVAALEDMAAKEGDFLAAMSSIALYYIKNYGDFSGIINQLRGLMAEAEPAARDKFLALHNHIADPIVREIRAAASRGAIREMDPELLARAVMGMVEFIAIFLSFDGRYSPPQAVSFLVDLLARGIDTAR